MTEKQHNHFPSRIDRTLASEDKEWAALVTKVAALEVKAAKKYPPALRNLTNYLMSTLSARNEGSLSPE